ncbi:MAG: PEP-CTERM sorting domain-containing protein [Verrucomicrobia bacterium]|nr:PEP-CTERM sorting domain-containing protein [Verrucomicrobiota bacterium]
MKKLVLISGLAIALATAGAHAQIATDNASNYGGSWTNGSNGGTGFLAWNITNNNNGTSIFAGNFLGDSTSGAGNINTGGVAFGLYANPAAASVNANRAFAVSLSSGNIFTFQLALNFDNGNKGFDFFAGGDGTVLNFNVGSGAGVSSSKTLTPGTSVVYDYGGNNAVFNVTLTMTSSSAFSYDISRTSSLGTQGTLFSGNVSGLTQGPTGIGFYVAGTDAGGAAQNNLYVNSLSVVPEPSTFALLGLGLAAFALRRKTKVS